MRCAVCGSKRVFIENKNEGFNTKKGILGTALFGISGALLGTNGNKKTYYHCADCGQVLNRAMNEIEENEINIAVLNKDDKPYNLEKLLKLKNKYKNIELSNEDEEKAIKYINSEKKMCDEDVINELKKYLNKYEFTPWEDIKNYMKKLGYIEDVIKQIPFELVYSIKSNIRIIYKNDKCYFSIDNVTPLEILQQENERVYIIAFKMEIEERKQDVEIIGDLGNEILNYILNKRPKLVSKTEIIEKYPQISWQKISSAISHNGNIKSIMKDKEFYFEIDSDNYDMKKLKEKIAMQNDEKIISSKKSKTNKEKNMVDADELLVVIDKKIKDMKAKEEKADFLELKKLYSGCNFTKSFLTNARINKIDYVYAIYIILKGNDFKNVEYNKFFRLHTIFNNNDLKEEEKNICKGLIVDCFRNDINIIKNITFEDISKISNNAVRDFEYINNIIIHELELISKK